MALFDIEAIRRATQQAVTGASAGPPLKSFDEPLQGLARQIFASDNPMTRKVGIDAPLGGTARPIGVSPQVWRRSTAGNASRKEEANVRRKVGIDAPLGGTARPIGVSPQVWRRFTAGKASRKEEANVRRKSGM